MHEACSASQISAYSLLVRYFHLKLRREVLGTAVLREVTNSPTVTVSESNLVGADGNGAYAGGPLLHL